MSEVSGQPKEQKAGHHQSRKLENETARKIFDFLSGATYALDGNVQKVANNIFVFAPENVDVMAGMEQNRANIPLNESPWRK